jgi:excisionase family DNA binding protein
MAKFSNIWHLLPFFPAWGGSMPDEILTLPEVAQLLKVAEKTVYTMAQKGELPAFKVRGQWRFKRADLDRTCWPSWRVTVRSVRPTGPTPRH